MHGERNAVHLALPAAGVEQGQSGEEADTGAAGGQQLFGGALQSVGFAEYRRALDGGLVRTDDQVFGIVRRERSGLGFGEAAHQSVGAFPGERAFVYIRAGADEWQAQALQQFAAIGRAGGEDQWQHGESPSWVADSSEKSCPHSGLWLISFDRGRCIPIMARLC
ncbi:hypothetical protein D3C76_1100150 [compost metagenome]